MIGARSSAFVDGGEADVHVGGDGRSFGVGRDMDKHSLSHWSCCRGQMNLHVVAEEKDRHILW